MTHTYSRVNIAASAEAARFDEDDTAPDAREKTAPDFDELAQSFQPTPEVVEDQESVTYLEAYFDEVHEGQCDEKAWSCDRSEAVEAEAKKCIASTAQSPTSTEACRKDACARASDRPWPAVIKERKVAANDQRSCHASAPESESEYGCHIASAHACTRRVGLICSGRARHSAKERTRVEEYLFLPPLHP